ncbi:MAG TPA: terminase [Actinoplanes sp.]|nr:terminase [Actinoplanes sp.]
MWTRPLRPLTPETSYGYAVIWFAAAVLLEPLDPWQQWFAIHAGELLPDGRPRFRRVLAIVARQNGKTHLLKVFALYWIFVERIGLVLGTSTKLDYAAESWTAAVNSAMAVPALAKRIPKRGGVRRGKGAEVLTTSERCRYKIGTADRSGGRSLPVERLIMDEVREHTTWDAYNASFYAMNAQPHGQAFMISNQGDEKAIVLRETRAEALAFLETGEGDHRLGIFEWSAPEFSDPLDPHAHAAANPQLGRRVDHDSLRSAALAATAPGASPEKLTGFLTENLCMDVPNMDPAIDPQAWADRLLVGTMDDARSRLAACIDLSPDGLHATLAVAALLADGIVRVETVHAWTGPGAASQMERELPGWLARIRPQVLGWMPTGPAAVVAAALADRRKAGVRGWPPPGTTVAEIRAELPAVCMGFAELVTAAGLAHSGQALLDGQVRGAEKHRRGDVWVFGRSGDAHVDALYAAAGAAHLARTLPTAVGKPRILKPKTR